MNKVILISLVGLFILSGCASYVTPGHTVKSDKAITKSGEAHCTFIPWYMFGDCSIVTAMKNGGITNIVSVDHKRSYFLYFFYVKTTIVSGY